MKHFFALPALLRASLLLASASPHAFSVQDDLLAFPQYDVKFAEEYLTEADARSRLQHDAQQVDSGALHKGPPSQVEQYQPPTGRDDGKKKHGQEYEHQHMILDGHRYVCSIPIVKRSADEAPGSEDALSKAEEEQELARATDRGWELLSGMHGNCMYFISGWWSYRFCYGQGVKQFHQLPPSRNVPVYPPVEDPGVEGYILGNYEAPKKNAGRGDESASKAATGKGWDGRGALDATEGDDAKHKQSGYGELVQGGESRYLVQRLGGGTQCDLTGKERKIEVQFHCNPQSADRISLIKETSTCAYLMVIQTPRLCNDVAFLPPQKDKPNTITCSPVLADDEIDKYERELEALKSVESEPGLHEADDDATAFMSDGDSFNPELQIMVGDILIGGHALVPEGATVEKSAIVGGGKETYVETVAYSDGRIISEEDLRRLGLGDPKAVQKLRKDLEQIAQGQKWKLDVIDTPHGRQYRGVIGDDEEGEKGGNESEDTGEKQEGAEQGARGGDHDTENDEEPAGSEEEYYKEEL